VCTCVCTAVEDSYDKEYMQHAYREYSHDDDDYKHKPECGPTQFDELKEPTCIEPNSGGSHAS
jgi:hypothetical protein